MLPASSLVASTIIDVLLVDTEGATGAYRSSLREKYRVHTASSVDAALPHLTRHSPALVITELTFSGTTGVEICRQAKALPVPSTVLVTTADVTHVPDALANGCDGVLLKPFAPNLLHARIGRLLRARRADGRLNGHFPTVKSHHTDGNGGAEPHSHGTNHSWPNVSCPHCGQAGATSFEFSSHRRSWYACLHCKQVWIGKRQE